MNYSKSQKYTDFYKIYDNCSGPGGLQISEFLAEKMAIKPGKRLIDIGFYRGYQTCFLAKEYDVNIVAIDPGEMIGDRAYGIEYLMKNAREFGVDDKVIGVKTSVPDTLLPSACFDYATSTNCLHMIKGWSGSEGYLAALKEIYRLLKKGGILGIGEPYCNNAAMSAEALAAYEKVNWGYTPIEESVKIIEEAGFTILETAHAKEANKWWKEYATYGTGDADEQMFIEKDNGQWLSFGYTIAVKE